MTQPCKWASGSQEPAVGQGCTCIRRNNPLEWGVVQHRPVISRNLASTRICCIPIKYIDNRRKEKCVHEKGSKVGFTLCKSCIKVDHCHQHWLMALSLQYMLIRLSQTGKLQGWKKIRKQHVCFFKRCKFQSWGTKLKRKDGVSLVPEMPNHTFYFMTTKFNVVDTPHQHPAIFSLVCYINQAL